MYIWNRFLHQLAGQLKRAENIIRQRIKRQETNQMKKNEKCYTNRELSWLQFNERVLNEAGTAGRTHDFCIHLPDESGRIFHGARGYTHDADECKRKGD